MITEFGDLFAENYHKSKKKVTLDSSELRIHSFHQRFVNLDFISTHALLKILKNTRREEGIDGSMGNVPVIIDDYKNYRKCER